MGVCGYFRGLKGERERRVELRLALEGLKKDGKGGVSGLDAYRLVSDYAAVLGSHCGVKEKAEEGKGLS